MAWSLSVVDYRSIFPVMPGPPGPAIGRPEDKPDPGIQSPQPLDRRVKPGDDREGSSQLTE
ncbi:hypothetical protein FRZ44_11620 [Hypericibacter terrae]|uniref:Uncharacterized protein n=1 Tax=Hypericibacter terrae TaxID=2602015 RepID=A0A5J6MEI1_9PROT|nr:hypothetical protein FRZ44_11620 [Hypericibacter terrae]